MKKSSKIMLAMRRFFESRWNGEIPLETVFWRDMLLVGTGVNIAAGGAALAMFAADYPAWLALAVNVLPLPWNLFLFLAVWRTAEIDNGPAGMTAKIIAVMWLITMFVL